MGWFLIGKPGGGKRARGKGKPKGRGGARKSTSASAKWNPRRTMLGVRLVVALALAGGVVLGWGRLESALSRYASRRHVAAIGPRRVTLVDQPAWMSPAVAGEVKAVVARRVTPDPMDTRSLGDAALALTRDRRVGPWVSRVGQVQRTPDGRVRVRAAYRQPVAVVRARDGYHLVDRQGVRLPGGPYFPGQARQLDLPMVRGVSHAPPPAGRVWPGADLQAGLALARALADKPYGGQVRAVDVSGRDARGRLKLVLDTGRGRVIWGLPIGQAGALEVPARQKLDRLHDLYASRGDLDDGGQLVRIYGSTIQVQPMPRPGDRPTPRRR